MNLAHVHIVLNHVPSLGSFAGLLLLAAALYQKNDELKKLAFLVLTLISMAIIPTYITGGEAERLVRQNASVSLPMIQVHQNAAMLTLLLMTITGTLAWFGLWEYRRFASAGPVTSIGALISSVLTAGFITFTASLGGKISHPEVRVPADAAVTEADGWRERIELFVGAQSWTWPAAETLHFIGMALLFGVSFILMLRMLGWLKSIPFSALHRLLPMAIMGFVVNVLTGMMFFIAGPGNYVGKDGFHMKMAGILVATLPVLYFTIFEEPWKAVGNADASAIPKIAAVLTFLLLVAVIIYGRFLPFLT